MNKLFSRLLMADNHQTVDVLLNKLSFSIEAFLADETMLLDLYRKVSTILRCLPTQRTQKSDGE